MPDLVRLSAVLTAGTVAALVLDPPGLWVALAVDVLLLFRVGVLWVRGWSTCWHLNRPDPPSRAWRYGQGAHSGLESDWRASHARTLWSRSTRIRRARKRGSAGNTDGGEVMRAGALNVVPDVDQRPRFWAQVGWLLAAAALSIPLGLLVNWISG